MIYKGSFEGAVRLQNSKSLWSVVFLLITTVYVHKPSVLNKTSTLTVEYLKKILNFKINLILTYFFQIRG